MIVVSDTSPITALLAAKEADLLKRLFGEVVIPKAVEAELLRTHPELPPWLRVQAVIDLSKARAF
jgi:predicted nucleic acid-binding protein